jgi:hypothetical protein
MSIKGKQIENKSIPQKKLNITTNSIIYNTDITNKEYVDNEIEQQVSKIGYNRLNRDMQAIGFEVGDKVCEYAIIEFNLTNVRVTVNGVDINIGPDQDCYFSNDEGITRRKRGQEQKGDYLYWNSSKYRLEATDEIDFIYLVGYKYLIKNSNTTIELDPYYNNIVVKYIGTINTSSVITLQDLSFNVGNINGNFVWDINGLNEHVFYYTNETWLQTINGTEYTIWYDRPGTLYFSIAKGNHSTIELFKF